MPAFNLTQKIALNLIATILVAVVMIGGILSWLATQADRQSIDATRFMVSGGLDQNLDALRRHVNDYAFWEEALIATNKGDREWLDGNVGSGVTESFTVNGVAITGPDLLVKHKWESASFAGRNLNYFPPKLLQQIRLKMRNTVARTEGTQSFYWQIDGSVVAYAFQWLTSEPDKTQVESAGRDVMIFAKELSPNDVLRLGSPFLINDLAIQTLGYGRPREPERASDFLQNVERSDIAKLTWTAPAPGTKLLNAVAVPVAAVFVLFLLSAGWTTWRAHIVAKQLEHEKQAATTLSQTDILTGLPNRIGLNQFLSLSEVRELAAEGAFVAWQIDIHNFKLLNETLGFRCGDEIIIALAKALRQLLPAESFIARSGGNEFLVIGFGFDAVSNAAVVSDKIGARLSAGFLVNAQKVHLNAAIGYAAATGNAQSPDDVIHRASLALSEAKAGRSNGAVAYDQSLDIALQQSKTIEVMLRRAIAENGFQVHYQPIYNTVTGLVDHAEALIRLSPDLITGIGPDVFIPIAEKSGLIQEIGMIVIRKVAEDAVRWPDIKISINVSPIQLLNNDFAKAAETILKTAGMKPSRVAFELTEGVLADSPDLVRRQLLALKKQGFEIYLDDFGAGFASIGYLKQFAFDAIKVDRLVVQAAFTSATERSSLDMVVKLAQTMQLEVFAEGVENKEQFDALAALGCQNLQGWHIGRASTAQKLQGVIDQFVFAQNDIASLKRVATELRNKAPLESNIVSQRANLAS